MRNTIRNLTSRISEVANILCPVSSTRVLRLPNRFRYFISSRYAPLRIKIFFNMKKMSDLFNAIKKDIHSILLISLHRFSTLIINSRLHCRLYIFGYYFLPSYLLENTYNIITYPPETKHKKSKTE